MLFLLPSLLLSLMIGVTEVQALTLSQEDKAEVISHWEPYLKNQDQDNNFSRYIEAILDINAVDAEVAGKIAELFFEKDQWKSFVQKRDLDATLSFIETCITVLQGIVWEGSQLRFPLQLVDIAQDMKDSGLTEEEYLTNVRRAFLAFTIIVSAMDQVVTFEQVA